MSNDPPRVAEFFAGIGLVRMGLEQEGFRIVFANDIDRVKYRLYDANFGSGEYLLRDIRELSGDDIPDVEVATASFPCIDLSLAGMRGGLEGEHSSTFWQFARVIGEMGVRKPLAVMIENVVGFGSSRDGEDLAAAIYALNGLGYWCDVLVVDAKHFVPQSRPRVFVIGSHAPSSTSGHGRATSARPAWIQGFVSRHPELRLNALPVELPNRSQSLADVVERLPEDDPRWWDRERMDRFLSSLSPIQERRLDVLRTARHAVRATAYRRTRHGRAMWEIRHDGISGCLRTARGGSSKQALVEAGHGAVKARWMTPSEYARLQG
ncbi:MAG: DNA cytosine methyltransferase, partial [Chloroflexota bacterium]